METKKSIFQLQKRRYLYYVKREQETLYNTFSLPRFCDKVCQTTEIISETLLGEYEFEIPVLSSGDNFYLSDIKAIVKIDEAIRCSDDRILYIVSDVTVQDGVSNISRDEAEGLLASKNEELYDKINRLKDRVCCKDNLIYELDLIKDKYLKLKNNWFIKTFIDKEQD